MRIFKIAKIIDNPKLEEAASKVVDGGQLILPVAENYRLDPEMLSKAVIDLRRARKLPIEKLLELYDNMNTKDISILSRKTKIPQDEIIWLLRKIRPEFRSKLTQEEIQEIIKLRNQGFTYHEIADKMQTAVSTIQRLIKEHSPKLVKSIRPNSFWDNIYQEYVNTIKPDHSNSEEIIQYIKQKYGIDRRIDIVNAIKRRGIINTKSDIFITPEEIKLIMNKALEGKSANIIAKETGRSISKVIEIIKENNPVLYDQNIKRKTVDSDITKYTLQLMQEGKKNQEIVNDLKTNFNIDATYGQIANIRSKKFKPSQPEQPIMESIPAQSKPVDNTDEPIELDFGPKLTPEEIAEQDRLEQEKIRKELHQEYRNLRQSNPYLTWDEFTTMKKKEWNYAKSLNWYKRAKRNENL